MSCINKLKKKKNRTEYIFIKTAKVLNHVNRSEYFLIFLLSKRILHHFDGVNHEKTTKNKSEATAAAKKIS